MYDYSKDIDLISSFHTIQVSFELHYLLLIRLLNIYLTTPSLQKNSETSFYLLIKHWQSSLQSSLKDMCLQLYITRSFTNKQIIIYSSTWFSKLYDISFKNNLFSFKARRTKRRLDWTIQLMMIRDDTTFLNKFDALLPLYILP